MKNGATLYIAEKPSVAAAIAEALGSPKKKNGYFETDGGRVSWLYGHLLRQAMPEEYDKSYESWSVGSLPIIPDAWKMLVSPDKKDQFKTVKELIADSQVIVHAGDPDREGQLLVDELLEYVGVENRIVQRILINAVDDTNVRRCLVDKRDNSTYQNLSKSGKARARFDWLIGLNGTRAFTLRAQAAGHKGVQNVGRVKSVVQSLVVERERAITDFKTVDYYVIKGLFSHGEKTFSATWAPDKDRPGLDSESRLVSKTDAEKMMSLFLSKTPDEYGTVTLYKKEKKNEPPKLPFSLSSLQAHANKMYGLSAKAVLEATDSLYNKKHLSYPRSSSEYLPESQHKDAKDILNALIKLDAESISDIAHKVNHDIKGRAWLEAEHEKIAIHHAIIPTSVMPDLSAISENETIIYTLVVMRYMMQFCEPCVYEVVTVELKYQEERFKASGRTVAKPGWTAIFKPDNADSADKDNPDQALPVMKEGDKAPFQGAELQEKKTKPPKRFTQGTLITAMKEIYKYVKDPARKEQLRECEGIGTEATRYKIIDDLFTGGFFEEKKKDIFPTEKCFSLVDMLPGALKEPDTTALMEDKMERIAKGRYDFDTFMKETEEETRRIIEAAKNATVKKAESGFICGSCGKSLSRRKGPNGYFWGCTGYPECKQSYPDNAGKPDMKPRQKAVASIHKCQKCGKALVIRKGKKGPFWGCIGYPDCRETYPDKEGQPNYLKK